MNYQKHYDQLMSSRKQYTSFGNLEYWEKHHIVPKCLGGPRKKENEVLLTAREHYIAHWLLSKIHKDNHKIQYAFGCMQLQHSNYRRFTSSQIERIKNVYSSICKIYHTGKKKSEETREKMSSYAKNRTDEHNKKLSEEEIEIE